MTLFQSYILPYLKKYKKLMTATIILGILSVLSASMLTFTSGYLISRASEMPATILLLYIPIVGVRTFGLSRAVTRYLERLAGHNAVLKILSELRVKLYGMLEPQAIFIRSRFQTGDLLGTLADDIEHLQDVYIRTIFPTLIGLFLFVYAVTILALFDWLFALWIALCLSVIVFVYPLLSLYFLKKWQRDSKLKRSRLYQTFTDAVFGISDWIISGKKEQFIEGFMEDSRKSHYVEKKLAYWSQSRQLQLQIFSGLIVLMVGIWAGMEAQQGEILPVYIAAFTLVTLPIIEGLIPLSHAIERIPAYQESLERIESIQEYVPYEKINTSEAEIFKEANLRIKDVSYRYNEQQEDALQAISLSIPHGQKLALLGKSGAGKSTLLQLLQGAIEPTSGSILMNGYKPSEYGEKIYEMIGVLNQKPYLFATTVENNIRLGNQQASKAEIERVIKQVKLDEYILSLPNGLQTQMEETGQRFSGGERQRIALARILLKDTPIVILDEPTVGLDPETEFELIETILTNLKDKTIIWITHHLIGIEQMDQILFLDKGKIAMQGTHEQLMQSNIRYRQLYTLDRGTD
ncbi:thiol reductant ABC exporter subunit CydC [Lederbergia lenta]|uniref:Cysteine ABC transporter permease/ATP-binding protein CydC n=1 Tax=Lederbergia lenta TaxID=1467 RepID=A0A2X4W0Y2_LEDLE|nr:thiol reductant ABC exporter subunit CydC [Lederbergia lenta]MEC2325781.1 thiol reductant ABC exporter subunit CydC [Lederbergia lenta]SQI53758.1 cysteine ABC transporter permease/ATP-binding protein CydC [Lederbergia lenta]